MNYEQLVEFLTNKMSMSHREEHGSWLLRTAFCTLHPPKRRRLGSNDLFEKLPRSKEPVAQSCLVCRGSPDRDLTVCRYSSARQHLHLRMVRPSGTVGLVRS